MNVDKSLHTSLAVSDEPARYDTTAIDNMEEVNISLFVRNFDFPKVSTALTTDRADLTLRPQTTQSELRTACRDLEKVLEDFGITIDSLDKRVTLHALWIISLYATCLMAAGLHYLK